MSIEAMSQAEMRSALGRFASGVTVVTGLDDEGPAGFVCQSFASVSLEPAMVLFCADHRGRSWPRIRRAGRFTVNVLHENQSDICSRFGSRDGRKFDDLDWEMSRWSTPALPEVLMRVHADIENVHTVGDHDVVIGRVLELEAVTEERPLIFFRGKLGIDAAPTRLSA
ncbi:flavin reductase family protein [Gordonia sp. zg691]|uniref:Flavin reductase family protein n=1 Tax=Gordonia jinghuaiqii TaxID=2758710 RepID=A0A7D7QG73_9ACTN|nr:flavin reductase family protein [Gordonia jinghuaiqii]MBD0862563.1 flavin reductase family protein [Gordonia jinghuaiqii]MCR5976664.1 flavin reductase [Gordonia jinghuaiqii]QMS99843.1 flavin reductase family protein [Gordonia jinghuaiqii]